LVRCSHWVLKALLQDSAKSVMNGVDAGSDSPLSLWYLIPWIVKTFGHATWLSGVSTPSANSAVEVTVFMVEPGATRAVSAKSLKPALLATARILPVDGWMTTIELSLCWRMADWAARSAAASMVVANPETFLGAIRAALVWATGLSFLVWISTSRP